MSSKTMGCNTDSQWANSVYTSTSPKGHMVSKSASLSIHDISAFSSAPKGHELGLKFTSLSALSSVVELVHLMHWCNRRLVINRNLKAKSPRDVCVWVRERDQQSSTELYIFFSFHFSSVETKKKLMYIAGLLHACYETNTKNDILCFVKKAHWMKYKQNEIQ